MQARVLGATRERRMAWSPHPRARSPAGAICDVALHGTGARAGRGCGVVTPACNRARTWAGRPRDSPAGAAALHDGGARSHNDAQTAHATAHQDSLLYRGVVYCADAVFVLARHVVRAATERP